MVQTTDGGEIEISFIGLFPINGVRVGEHEMSLEHFGAMAIHFLGGGFFGWSNNETPEAMNNALSQLFEMHEQVDGKWVRKAKYRATV
ncbi:MAG: hypothetical protein AAB857_01545 [Patescibacteria group bacterium]